MVKEFLEENWVKRWWFGVGRFRVMGEEEEDYMVRCIVEKSIVYGGWYNIIMYLNYWVKKRYFLLIVNYSLL